jgi:hypothetical protein
MIRYITTLFAVLFASNAYAFDITVGVPPGGVTGKTATILQEIQEKSGIKNTINALPNCAVVKNAIENEKQPLVYLTGSWGVVDDACKLTYSDNVKVIQELYYYSYSLCYRKDKTNLGMQNFLDKTTRKNIAITTASNNIIQKIIGAFPNGDSANIVIVGNSGKAREVILGNEFDYTLVDSEWLGKNLDKVNCLFSGSESDIVKDGVTIPSVYKLLPKAVDLPLLQDSIVLVGANLSQEQIQNINNQIKTIRNNQSWKDFVNEFGRIEITSENKFIKIIKSIRGE